MLLLLQVVTAVHFFTCVWNSLPLTFKAQVKAHFNCISVPLIITITMKFIFILSVAFIYLLSFKFLCKTLLHWLFFINTFYI